MQACHHAISILLASEVAITSTLAAHPRRSPVVWTPASSTTQSLISQTLLLLVFLLEAAHAPNQTQCLSPTATLIIRASRKARSRGAHHTEKTVSVPALNCLQPPTPQMQTKQRPILVAPRSIFTRILSQPAPRKSPAHLQPFVGTFCRTMHTKETRFASSQTVICSNYSRPMAPAT